MHPTGEFVPRTNSERKTVQTDALGSVCTIPKIAQNRVSSVQAKFREFSVTESPVLSAILTDAVGRALASDPATP